MSFTKLTMLLTLLGSECARPEFVRVELERDKKVRLDTIRDLAKGSEFIPGEARVRVRGKALESEGKWQFQIEGLDQTYGLEFVPDVRPPRPEQRIVAEGVVLPLTDPRARPVLRLTAVEPEP